MSETRTHSDQDQLSTHYIPTEVEERWYAHWDQAGYFHSDPDDREPYTIVIPPPNVTGVLHMGHMLNNTIQDVLIRRARMTGHNACWVPGTDHASIATEAKVVRWLREEKGLSKGDLGREAFMTYAWEWTDKYGGIILQQLRRLGASCDWRRQAFTLDEVRSKAVIDAFVDLYHQGKLYRDYRMVNWDPEAKTVLSNEEVLYEEEQGQLFYVRYKIVGADEAIVIATTRPETILADTAVAVHPDDERYRALIGREVIVPIAGRTIPIIADDYVDPEFGTGALKITPAHDPNDYEIGQRHELPIIDMFTDDAKVAEGMAHFVGMDRFEARTAMKEALKQAELLVEIKSHNHKVGRSERTKAVVEPKRSLQWYVDMKAIAAPAIDAVRAQEVKLHPKNQENLYFHWMENIRDWCISRQLWWGHRIPAYYYEDEVFVAATDQEALSLARAAHPDVAISVDDLRQEEDVLDTWFSSWLWPYSVFLNEDGDDTDVNYYYPTSVLVTGWDIIFLWVARMVMAGYEWKEKGPFADVYFTGMVRDKQRRKMSKSLGNSPDALGLIDKYGADGVRFGMLSCAPAGGDLLFDEKLCDQGAKFCNKMWNALKLIKGWESSTHKELRPQDELAIAWMAQRICEVRSTLSQQMDQYRLNEGLVGLYTLIWSDFCSWYLEMVKPSQGDDVSQALLDGTTDLYSQLMVLLHPYMPFVTEEIWHRLEDRAPDDDCMMQRVPTDDPTDAELLGAVKMMQQLVVAVREQRSKYQVKERELLHLTYEADEAIHVLMSRAGMMDLIERIGYISSIKPATVDGQQGIPFLVDKSKFYLLGVEGVDHEQEKTRLQEEYDYVSGFLKQVDKKLSNERFVQNAPEAVVAKERQKQADGQARLRLLRDSLMAYGVEPAD